MNAPVTTPKPLRSAEHILRRSEVARLTEKHLRRLKAIQVINPTKTCKGWGRE